MTAMILGQMVSTSLVANHSSRFIISFGGPCSGMYVKWVVVRNCRENLGTDTSQCQFVTGGRLRTESPLMRLICFRLMKV